MNKNHAIELTPLESLYLSDALSMFTQGPPDALQGQASPYPELLLKVGGAVLETQKRKAAVTVNLTLSELWMVREVAKSSVVVGNERVGLTLLTKVYEGIRALASDSDVQSVINAFGEVVEDEPGKGRYATQLKRIKESSDLETGGESNDAEHEDGDQHHAGDTDQD